MSGEDDLAWRIGVECVYEVVEVDAPDGRFASEWSLGVSLAKERAFERDAQSLHATLSV